MQASADGFIDLSVSHLGSIGDGGVKIVSMRTSPFHEVERDISNCAVISEVFKGIWPKQNAQSSKHLKDEANCEQYSASEEIKIYSIFGSERLPNI